MSGSSKKRNRDEDDVHSAPDTPNRSPAVWISTPTKHTKHKDPYAIRVFVHPDALRDDISNAGRTYAAYAEKDSVVSIDPGIKYSWSEFHAPHTVPDSILRKIPANKWSGKACVYVCMFCHARTHDDLEGTDAVKSRRFVVCKEGVAHVLSVSLNVVHRYLSWCRCCNRTDVATAPMLQQNRCCNSTDVATAPMLRRCCCTELTLHRWLQLDRERLPHRKLESPPSKKTFVKEKSRHLAEYSFWHGIPKKQRHWISIIEVG